VNSELQPINKVEKWYVAEGSDTTMLIDDSRLIKK
jgi:hypothetical protein